MGVSAQLHHPVIRNTMSWKYFTQFTTTKNKIPESDNAFPWGCIQQITTRSPDLRLRTEIETLTINLRGSLSFGSYIAKEK